MMILPVEFMPEHELSEKNDLVNKANRLMTRENLE